MRSALVWVGGLAVLSAVAAYALAPACLAFFAGAVALEVLYCSLRSVTWAKTFVSGAMVGVGGLAGWVAVAPLSTRAASFFAFLFLWEIAGRNLPNDLADLMADSRTQIRTVATAFGNATSARVTLAGAIATVLALALLPVPLAAAAGAAMLGLWAMAVPAARLVRTPTSDQAGAYFNRASLLPALVLPVVIVAQLLVAR